MNRTVHVVPFHSKNQLKYILSEGISYELSKLVQFLVTGVAHEDQTEYLEVSQSTDIQENDFQELKLTKKH